MRETVSKKTYEIVWQRYRGKCQYPLCDHKVRPSIHHIIFRSKVKALTDNPDNCILLCDKHHRTDIHSPHKSQHWREYYYQFLPPHLKALINYKTTGL